MIFGIISLYANPLHSGHIDYITEAASQCNHLTCIVNNDEQVKIKGSIPFQSLDERCKILSHIREIKDLVRSIDTDESVAQTLRAWLSLFDVYTIQENCFLFINGGDRQSANPKESAVCEEFGVHQVFLPDEKIQSSSSLIEKAAKAWMSKNL